VKSFNDFISQFKIIEPLSNFQLIEKCEELQIQKFKDVFMRDELNKNRKSTKDECLILNIDESRKQGTHWTCLFIKNDKLYFDSYGFPPPLDVEEYYTGNERYYNSFKIQQNNEVICGHYCIYVLYRLSNGYDFYGILDELVRLKDLK
jgi:hypothetical protein